MTSIVLPMKKVGDDPAGNNQTGGDDKKMVASRRQFGRVEHDRDVIEPDEEMRKCKHDKAENDILRSCYD